LVEQQPCTRVAIGIERVPESRNRFAAAKAFGHRTTHAARRPRFIEKTFDARRVATMAGTPKGCQPGPYNVVGRASSRRHDAGGERRDIELVISAKNQRHFEEPAFPPSTDVPSAREPCGYRRRHIIRFERHGRRQQVQDPPAGCADRFGSEVERGRVVHSRKWQDCLQPLHDGKRPDVRDGSSTYRRARCFRDLLSGVLVPEQANDVLELAVPRQLQHVAPPVVEASLVDQRETGFENGNAPAQRLARGDVWV
jgi:hypothetical protein